MFWNSYIINTIGVQCTIVANQGHSKLALKKILHTTGIGQGSYKTILKIHAKVYGNFIFSKRKKFV